MSINRGGIFGWSYPPGCSGPPEDDFCCSDLVEELLGIMEDHGVPEEVHDKVIAIIEAWEEGQDDLLGDPDEAAAQAAREEQPAQCSTCNGQGVYYASQGDHQDDRLSPCPTCRPDAEPLPEPPMSDGESAEVVLARLAANQTEPAAGPTCVDIANGLGHDQAKSMGIPLSDEPFAQWQARAPQPIAAIDLAKFCADGGPCGVCGRTVAEGLDDKQGGEDDHA